MPDKTHKSSGSNGQMPDWEDVLILLAESEIAGDEEEEMADIVPALEGLNLTRSPKREIENVRITETI